MLDIIISVTINSHVRQGGGQTGEAPAHITGKTAQRTTLEFLFP